MEFRKKMWRLTGKLFKLMDHNRSDILIRMNKAAKTKIKKKRAKSKLTPTQQMKAEFMDWNRERYRRRSVRRRGAQKEKGEKALWIF